MGRETLPTDFTPTRVTMVYRQANRHLGGGGRSSEQTLAFYWLFVQHPLRYPFTCMEKESRLSVSEFHIHISQTFHVFTFSFHRRTEVNDPEIHHNKFQQILMYHFKIKFIKK